MPSLRVNARRWMTMLAWGSSGHESETGSGRGIWGKGFWWTGEELLATTSVPKKRNGVGRGQEAEVEMDRVYHSTGGTEGECVGRCLPRIFGGTNFKYSTRAIAAKQKQCCYCSSNLCNLTPVLYTSFVELKTYKWTHLSAHTIRQSPTRPVTFSSVLRNCSVFTQNSLASSHPTH